MRVLVVGDHEMARKGICSILATDSSLSVCGEAVDGPDALDKARALQPEIVVMNLAVTDLNGLEVTGDIKRLLPQTEIIIVSQHRTPKLIRQILNAGACAHVMKSNISTDLLTAVASVAHHNAEENVRDEKSAMAILQEVSARFGNLNLNELVEASLDAAIALTGAQRGNVQLLDTRSETLRIVTQRGFMAPFLNFFAEVPCGATSVCGAAMQIGGRIAVDDVLTSDIFVGKPVQQVLLDAKVRAVQSTPLLGRSGRLLGIMSTHHERPHRLTLTQLQALDVLARQVAGFIERCEAEDVLRNTATQFHLVTDTMAVAVTRCSRDLRYLWVNSRYAEWMCRPAAEIINQPIFEVLGREAFESLRPHFDRVLDGHPVSYEQQATFRGIGRRWISAAYTPTFDSAGIADGWVAAVTDITERKRRDAERTKQARLLDFSFNAVIVLGTEDRITYWNRGAEELYGWKREEALGQVIHTLLQTEFPESLDSISARLRREDRWQGELVHIHKYGQRLTVLSRRALARDPETDSESIVEVNTDITQTKHAERQLSLLVETLEARISDRTLDLERATEKLRELSGKLLQTQDEERRRIARELHDGVGQLLVALNMNLSGLSREKTKFSSDASQVLDETVALTEQALQEIRTLSHLLHPPLLDEIGLESALHWFVDGFSKRSKITVQVQAPAGFSKGLPRDVSLALFRIVQECLTNIHRHSGSRTALVVIHRSLNEIVLEVKDKGSGFRPETEPRISPGESSGVGLRGMRERVRQFGGRLEISSDQNGTSVAVAMPIPVSMVEDEIDSELQDSAIARNGAVPSSGPATVLCIDDEEAGLLPRRLLLESAGHRVIEARSGEQGIRLFQTERIHAVILDYWMSGMKGTTVASELKRINPAVPIIVLSGMSDLPGEASGLVDQWIVKGSQRPEQLLDSLNTLLERRPV